MKIPYHDYQKMDANMSMLYKARKFIASDCEVHKPEDKDTNVDLILEGLDKFQPLFDPVMKEMSKTMAYTDEQFERDQSQIDKLTYNKLFPTEDVLDQKSCK